MYGVRTTATGLVYFPEAHESSVSQAVAMPLLRARIDQIPPAFAVIKRLGGSVAPSVDSPSINF